MKSIWKPKFVLVRFYAGRRSPQVILVIFREGEVPFTTEIYKTPFFYRIVARSHDLEQLKARSRRKSLKPKD